MTFVAYDICRIMTFVGYDVCRIMMFVGYDVCPIMMFVAYDIFECVTYRVCRSAPETRHSLTYSVLSARTACDRLGILIKSMVFFLSFVKLLFRTDLNVN